MSQDKFKAEIITPERRVFTGDAYHVRAVSIGGSFGIKAHHAPFLTLLKTGIIEITLETGNQRYAASKGYCKVIEDKATFLMESAEAAEEIDIERAEQARKRALARLKKGESDLDVVRAQYALQRAVNRIRLASL